MTQQSDALALWRAIFGNHEGHLGLFSGRREEGEPALKDVKSHYLYYPLGADRAAEWCLAESEVGREVYFCAHLLDRPQRRRAYAAPIRALWADGDGAEIPEGFPEPSVVIESSPGRHQYYWLLSDAVKPKAAESLNKRLAIAIGADASGYDLTQLLRVPGTANRKYPGTPPVVLGGITGEIHDPATLDRRLPALPEPEPKAASETPSAGFDIEDWLERHPEAQDGVIERRDDDAARVKFAVVCPWVQEYTGGDQSGTFVGQFPNGALFFQCHHDHCAGRSWGDYRAFYQGEPEYDTVKLVKGAETLRDMHEDGQEADGRDTLVSPVTPATAGVSRPEPAGEPGGEPARDTVTPVTGGLLSSDPSARGGGFPVHALPSPLRRFVVEAAHAKETPVEFVALPLLAALGTAIGASRRFRIERTWGEYPTLYAATVALPASGKSPAEDAAMGPVEHRKKAFNQEYRFALEEYKQKYQEWEVEASEARRKKKRLPSEPEKPVKKRIRIGDATLEAVQQKMVENPRGLVLARDELAGFFNSLNQYRAGSDREFWLSQHSGRVPPLDRKTNDESHDMDYPCVSILGSIQPEKLNVLDIGAGDGMVERFLFAWPEAEIQPDAERDISVEAEDGYHRVWEALYALEMGEDEYGNPAPKDVPLAPDAVEVWKAYRRAIKHSAYEPGTSAFMQGVLGKMKGHVPRLALILALTRTVLSGAPREEVCKEDLDNAWELARYFVAQSHRVYTEFVGVNKDTLLARALGRFLETTGGEWTGPATELFDALKNLGYAAALPKSPDALTPAVLKVCRNTPALSAVQNKRTREGRSLTIKRAYASGVTRAS